MLNEFAKYQDDVERKRKAAQIWCKWKNMDYIVGTIHCFIGG